MGKFHLNKRSQEVLPINGSDILRVEGFMLRNPNRGFKVEKKDDVDNPRGGKGYFGTSGYDNKH